MNFGKTVDELSIGEKAVVVREVSKTDLALFAGATGDRNPIHFDEEYAEGTFFKGKIAHGILSAGFISAVIANRLPGLGTIYVSQNLRFLAPVRIGDRIAAEIEVLSADAETNRVQLRTTCTNQDGTVVLDGEAVVLPPKRKPTQVLERKMARNAAQTSASLEQAVRRFDHALEGSAERSPLPGAQAVSPWTTWLSNWAEMTDVAWQQTEMLTEAWMAQTDQAQNEFQAFMGRWIEDASDANARLWNPWSVRMRAWIPGWGGSSSS